MSHEIKTRPKTNIKFFFKSGKHATKTLKKNPIFGNEDLPRTQVFEWFKGRFRNGPD